MGVSPWLQSVVEVLGQVPAVVFSQSSSSFSLQLHAPLYSVTLFSANYYIYIVLV